MANKTSVITIRVEPDVRKVLEKKADQQDRTLAWITTHYLRKALEADQLLPVKSDG
jgi:predicted transcriptional regulator